MADDLSSLAYDLESMVKGQWYLRTWEMGPVEGETEVVVEPMEEDAEDNDVDMTLKE